MAGGHFACSDSMYMFRFVKPRLHFETVSLAYASEQPAPNGHFFPAVRR